MGWPQAMTKSISLVWLCCIWVSSGRRAIGSLLENEQLPYVRSAGRHSGKSSLTSMLLAMNPTVAGRVSSAHDLHSSRKSPTQRIIPTPRRQGIAMQQDSPPAADRIAAIIPYMLPSIDVYRYGAEIYADNPAVRAVAAAFYPLVQSLQSSQWATLVLFIGLSTIARSQNYPVFLRFNVMQALIVDIVIIILTFLAPVLGFLVGQGIADTALYLSIMTVIVYSIVSIILVRLQTKCQSCLMPLRCR